MGFEFVKGGDGAGFKIIDGKLEGGFFVGGGVVVVGGGYGGVGFVVGVVGDGLGVVHGLFVVWVCSRLVLRFLDG